MSRKGKLPVPIPKGVEVKIQNNQVVVKGPKGQLEQNLIPEVEILVEEGQIKVQLTDGNEENKNFHGLYRTLVENLVVGVTQGYERVLEMIGVGYRASVKGNDLDLQIGVSHPVLLPIPEGITVKVEKNTTIILNGNNKQQIGQFAAVIRSKRPPEPYQGKGIRYKNEYVRRKAGKSAAKK